MNVVPFSSMLIGASTGAGIWLVCSRLQHQQQSVEEFKSIGIKVRTGKFLAARGINLKTLRLMNEKKLSSYGIDDHQCAEILRIVRREEIRKCDDHLKTIATTLSTSNEKTVVPTEMIVVAHSLFEIGEISQSCLKEVTDLFTPHAHPLTPHSASSLGSKSSSSSSSIPVVYTNEGSFSKYVSHMQKTLRSTDACTHFELQAARWTISHLLSYNQMSLSDANILTELIRSAQVIDFPSPVEDDVLSLMSPTNNKSIEGTMRCIMISIDSGTNLELEYLHNILVEDFNIDCSILQGSEATISDVELVLEELQAEAAWRSEDGSASSGVLRTLLIYQNHGGNGISFYGDQNVTEQWLLDRIPPNTSLIVDNLESLHFFTKSSVDDFHSLTLNLRGSPKPPASLAFSGYVVPVLTKILSNRRGVVPFFLSDCIRSVQLKFPADSVPIQGVPAAPFHQRIV